LTGSVVAPDFPETVLYSLKVVELVQTLTAMLVDKHLGPMSLLGEVKGRLLTSARQNAATFLPQTSSSLSLEDRVGISPRDPSRNRSILLKHYSLVLDAEETNPEIQSQAETDLVLVFAVHLS